MSEQPSATSLAADQIKELRERAAREAGPFVDPHVQRMNVPNSEWAEEILGHSYYDTRRLTWPDLYLLYIAHAAEPNPPDPPKLTAAREAARMETEAAHLRIAEAHAADVRAWQVLAAGLPVSVEVRHNYTSSRHYEFYTQGADHIYLLEDLHAGRLHRPRGRVLCWTPSRARDLSEFPEPAGDSRVPSCKACLKIARRLAARKEN